MKVGNKLIALILIVGITFVAYRSIIFFYLDEEVDALGRTPTDIVQSFVKSCQIRDYDEAQTFWTEDSLVRMEQNRYIGDINNFFSDVAKSGFREFKMRRGKYHDIIMVVATGRANDLPTQRIFYLEMHDSAWMLYWPKGEG
ncbi:hypothetical protein [Cerasicoccus frondis]|uniref:hypothetical protein n=1 Tax=Cerasicoccus frondis TaxID=490090 RepID=UPI002852CA3B|nr:hypothetical protein [Cerasicoccus frondis]